MIKKNKFNAKNNFQQPLIDALLEYVEADQDGFIQHPINQQIGINPPFTLLDLINELVLDVPANVDDGNGNMIPNQQGIDWYNNNDNPNHVWNPQII